MTLLVGVLCSNGAIIAADRQATHGAMGQLTIGQSVTKIDVINGDCLYGTSGHAGFGQQLTAIVNGQRPEFTQQNYADYIPKLQDLFRPLINKALQTAGIAASLFGAQVAMQDAVCGGLLAAPFKDGLKLVEISPQAAVEYMREECPFISMGSGKTSADPFLGFLRKVYWPTGLPNVREGALAAYWTIHHAIEMKVFGVGFAADVFVIEAKDNEGFVARKLDDAELAEHSGFIAASEAALRDVRDTMRAPSTEGNPAATPPTLDSA